MRCATISRLLPTLWKLVQTFTALVAIKWDNNPAFLLCVSALSVEHGLSCMIG